MSVHAGVRSYGWSFGGRCCETSGARQENRAEFGLKIAPCLPVMIRKRQFPRFSLRMPVLCEGKALPDQHGLGLTRNVSRGGLLLEISQSLEPGTPIGLRMLAGNRIARAEAEVVWKADQSPDHMGLRFTDLSGEDCVAWEHLLTFQAGPTPRASLRIPIDLEVTCVLPPGTQLQGRAENLSDGGLLVVLPQIVIPQTRLTVAVPPWFPLPPVEAEVVWMLAAPEGRGILHGLRFIAEDAGRQQFLLGALFRRLLD